MLEDNGISCWMGSRNILGGNRFTSEITKAIEECRVFVLVLSPIAQDSPWVFRELECAVRKRKVVIPYIIEETILDEDFHMLLSTSNGINAYEKDNALQELCERVLFFIESKREEKGRSYILATPICTLCKSTRVGDCLSWWSSVWLRIEWLLMQIFSICIAIMGIMIIGLLIGGLIGMILLLFGINGDTILINSTFVSDIFKEYLGYSLPITLDNILDAYMHLLVMLTVGFSASLSLWVMEVVLEKKVKQNRLRKGIHVKYYRCYNCNHRFRVKEKIKNDKQLKGT